VNRGESGLDLLASPEQAVTGRLDPDKIRSVIDFVTGLYKYTVIDLPRSDSAVLDALDRLSAIVIVTNHELATVRGASRMAASLRKRYGVDKVSVIVSRSDGRSEIAQADIERAIGFEVARAFPSDYRHALQALHKGRPMTLDDNNELSSAIKRFAFDLAGVKPERPAQPRSGLLGRLTQAKRF
jgi:Flp pilus assembly CpaE family ATPase